MKEETKELKEEIGNEVVLTRVANGYILRPQQTAENVARNKINYKDYFVFVDKESLASWIRIHGAYIPPEVDSKVEDLPF